MWISLEVNNEWQRQTTSSYDVMAVSLRRCLH